MIHVSYDRFYECTSIFRLHGVSSRVFRTFVAYQFPRRMVFNCTWPSAGIHGMDSSRRSDISVPIIWSCFWRVCQFPVQLAWQENFVVEFNKLRSLCTNTLLLFGWKLWCSSGTCQQFLRFDPSLPISFTEFIGDIKTFVTLIFVFKICNTDFSVYLCVIPSWYIITI